MILTILTYIAAYLTVGLLVSLGLFCILDEEDYGMAEAHTTLFLWPLVVAATIYYSVIGKGDDEW
tara:strand:- start:5711 stop:5905 length:195 start_codon:yes stop_codon:yes gene_type:complete